MNSQAQLSAAQHLASGAGAGMPNLQSAGVGGGDDDDDDIPELEAVEEDGNIDETGVDPKDIELVIQQVGCSRAKAVKVLKESGGDLINASACLQFSAPFQRYSPVPVPALCAMQSWRHASDRLVLFLYFYCSALHSKASHKGIPSASFITHAPPCLPIV